MSALKITHYNNSLLYQLWQKASTLASLIPMSVLLAKEILNKPYCEQENQDIFQEEFSYQINKLKAKLTQNVPIAKILAKLDNLQGLIGSH